MSDIKSVPVKSNLSSQHTRALKEIELYKLLVDSVQDYAIFMLDVEGNVMTWNKGAQKIKGYLPNEIIGKHFSSFYLQKDKDADKPKKELELASKFGRVEDEDWRVRKDGSRFWANVVITALFNGDHEQVGFAKVTRDLTERKNQEDLLRQVNVQLKKQQHELETMNKSKDEFISLASHQLRTPATGIKQYLGMLLDGMAAGDADTERDFINKAYQSNERQLDIVENLLKVAQIDAGKVILAKSPVDMCVMVNNIIQDYSETFESRHQAVEYNIPQKPIVNQVDPTYLRMALENIIDNASKYTPNEGKITIAITSKDENTVITIQDNGVGIARDDMAKLFRKFTRIPNSLSESVSGTGLGLYWLQKVIELHGGEITVESKLHKGTCFTVKLPIVEGHA